MHRSQHDPLVTDQNAPQRVLVEATSRQPQKHKGAAELDSVKRKEEERKYGIHFDDDYDYLQHLKKPGEHAVVWEYVDNQNNSKKCLSTKSKLCLPSSVFASEFEEDVGMLHKAAPQPGPHPEWDPDVVAALDNDFDFDNEENQLEDDFVLKAMCGDDEKLEEMNQENIVGVINALEECEISTEHCSESDRNDDEEKDHLGPLKCRDYFKVETGSRFTEYSMSSSVIRRNEQLTLLDDRFERFYASYDEPELGDLSMDEIEGPWHQKHPYLKQCFEIFKKSEKVLEYNKNWDEKRLNKYRYVDEDEKVPEFVDFDKPDSNKGNWDCETILSTYTNSYNHPKIIEVPQRKKISETSKVQNNQIIIDDKSGMPMGAFNDVGSGNQQQLTEKTLSMLEKSGHEYRENQKLKTLSAKTLASTLSVLSLRPKDENVMEKRERKRLVKEYRRERRIERKANASAFKTEKKRQIALKLNQRQNQQGIKML